MGIFLEKSRIQHTINMSPKVSKTIQICCNELKREHVKYVPNSLTYV